MPACRTGREGWPVPTPGRHDYRMASKYLGAIIIGAVLALGHAWTLFAGYAALCGLAYAFSLRAHPRAVCPACKGTGKHTGLFWSNNWRACRRCGGGQRHRGGVRWGLGGEQGQKSLPGNRRRGGA